VQKIKLLKVFLRKRRDYLKKILPIKIKDIIFVIHKRVAPLNYSVLNNKKIHFVIGDSDNI